MESVNMKAGVFNMKAGIVFNMKEDQNIPLKKKNKMGWWDVGVMCGVQSIQYKS